MSIPLLMLSRELLPCETTTDAESTFVRYASRFVRYEKNWLFNEALVLQVRGRAAEVRDARRLSETVKRDTSTRPINEMVK